MARPGSVRDLIHVLNLFFSPGLSLLNVVGVLLKFVALYPIIQLYQTSIWIQDKENELLGSQGQFNY